MHFAAFFCAAVTKQRGKQLPELMMRFEPKSNNMNTVQRGEGEQSNSGLVAPGNQTKCESTRTLSILFLFN